MARVSIHAPRSVPGNHNKFAIAVTRARVDSPSFLVVSLLPVCTLRISRLAGSCTKMSLNRCQCAKFRQIQKAYAIDRALSRNKVYALQVKIHVVFNGQWHWIATT
jgi:hypothetical protein